MLASVHFWAESKWGLKLYTSFVGSVVISLWNTSNRSTVISLNLFWWHSLKKRKKWQNWGLNSARQILTFAYLHATEKLAHINQLFTSWDFQLNSHPHTHDKNEGIFQNSTQCRKLHANIQRLSRANFIEFHAITWVNSSNLPTFTIALHTKYRLRHSNELKTTKSFWLKF